MSDNNPFSRNLNPNNLLLGERGHLMLSYMVGRETQLALVPLLHEGRLQRDCCVAPELQRFPLLDEAYNQRVGDFWSFGAILYELIIGMVRQNNNCILTTDSKVDDINH